MFEYIKGKITQIYPSYLVVEAYGIGYHILMANPFRLTEKEDVMIYLYQNVTQDNTQLFGFRTYNEKELFLKLINVSGIGPKSALGILANEDHGGLIRAIEDEDVKFLQKFPGVGKKTASQIVLDLKGKLSELSPEQFAAYEEETKEPDVTPLLKEALEALSALGYSQREIKKIKDPLKEMEETTTDAYIREGLRLLLHS